MTVIGVDPGISGALAFVPTCSLSPRVFDMPKIKLKNGKNEVCAKQLTKLIETFAHPKSFAIVEAVGAHVYVDRFGMRRGQGAAASFAFGKSFGVLLGVLAALRIRVELVQPAVWKSLLNLNSDKNLSRALAMKKFPSLKERLERKKDDGRAEALLLADFARSRYC